VRVCVLGRTRVFDGDGRELDLGARKHRELLALLAAADGRPVPASVLADRLWRGRPPPTAAGTLQGYVARLRRIVEPDRGRPRLLVTRGDGYALELPPGALDAARFAELGGAAHAALDRGDPAGAVDAARSAVALWAGAPYDDVADVDAVAPETVRLAELRTGVAEDLAAARLELGEHSPAVPELRDLVAAHPLRERSHGLLALALYRCGRQAEALAVLREVRERLAEELGIDPSAELRDLETAILRQDPALRAPAGPAAAPGLVGRRSELAALDAAWARARAGSTVAVLVVGEPGVGKTALVEAFCGRTGMRPRWGRALQTPGVPPYWPWLQALDGLPAVRDDGERARFALGVEIARRVGETAPQLVVLDDLQWADADSLHVLQVVLAVLDAPAMLVLTTRTDGLARPELAQVAAELVRRPGGTRVELRGLDEEDVGDLVTTLTGSRPDPDALRALVARTGGNPFFVTELAGHAPSSATGRVHDVLRSRLAELPGEVVQLLAVCAVAGTDLSLGIAAAALAHLPEQLEAGLAAALRSGLLLEPAPGRLRVAHDLVREAVLAGLNPARRAALHAELADALDATADPRRVAAVAVHRSEAAAGAPDKSAALACLHAAEDASTQGADADAAALAARGVQHVPAGDAGILYDLELVRGTAERRLGNLEQSAEALRHAAALARGAGDAARLARAAVAAVPGGVGGYWSTFTVPFVTATELLDEAAGLVGELDPALAGTVLSALAAQRAALAQPGAEELADRAAVLAGADSTARTRAAIARLAATWTPDTLHVRLPRVDALLAETADPVLSATLLHMRRVALLEAARVGEALAVSRRFAELARRRGDGDLMMLDTWWRAALHQMRGEHAEAIALVDEAGAGLGLSAAARLLHRLSREALLGIQAWYEGRLGDVVPRAVDLTEVEPGWLLIQAMGHAQAGRTAEARAALSALDRWPVHGSRTTTSVVLRTEACVAIGDADRLAGLLPALRSYGDAVIVFWPGPTCLGPAALFRGSALAVLGHEAEARVELEGAIALGTALGALPSVALARERLQTLLP
jgi:DNA-binding SARP family transcriptional activator